jgi:ATP-dependent exoDNAse (exonuclease V) alpha subunit
MGAGFEAVDVAVLDWVGEAAAGKRSRIVFRKFNKCVPDPRTGVRRYRFGEFNMLMPAYAATIHKSQGRLGPC